MTAFAIVCTEAAWFIVLLRAVKTGSKTRPAVPLTGKNLSCRFTRVPRSEDKSVVDDTLTKQNKQHSI